MWCYQFLTLQGRSLWMLTISSSHSSHNANCTILDDAHGGVWTSCGRVFVCLSASFTIEIKYSNWFVWGLHFLFGLFVLIVFLIPMSLIISQSIIVFWQKIMSILKTCCAEEYGDSDNSVVWFDLWWLEWFYQGYHKNLHLQKQSFQVDRQLWGVLF